MIKIIDPAGFNFDQPITSLVEVHSKGVEAGWMRKTAAVLTKELSEIRPETGKTFMHVIALGDSETYSANRNGDMFPKEANVKYHPTFVKYAKFFKNHKNKPERGDPSYGTVKAAAYNPDMHRVELIIAIDNAKAPDTIEKIASGKDIPVSMACRVPADFCNICLHPSKTTSEYCDHLKKHATQILSDGRVVGMINREPTFFDISEVWRPADRIAYSLRKVASAAPAIFSADLAQQYNVTAPMLIESPTYQRRYDLLQKLAALEQSLVQDMRVNPSLRTISLAIKQPIGLDKQASSNEIGSLFNMLKASSVSLTPEDFFKTVCGKRYVEIERYMPSMKSAAATMFTDALKNAEEIIHASENYETAVDKPLSHDVKAIIKDAVSKASLNGQMNRKVIDATLQKTASLVQYEKSTPQGKALAQEYAAYKLALLDGSNAYTAQMSILQNL